jgi:hypothetical protein
MKEVALWFLFGIVLICMIPIVGFMVICALWHWDRTALEGIETVFSTLDNAINNKSVTS